MKIFKVKSFGAKKCGVCGVGLNPTWLPDSYRAFQERVENRNIGSNSHTKHPLESLLALSISAN